MKKIIPTPSPNFNERPTAIDAIIIHYTDMISVEATLAWLINPASKVSAHYLISEEGLIYQMVAEDKRAWHAGESAWQGRPNVNGYSIGIELANPGHSHGYQPFPEAQIEALSALCLDIKKRWNIPTNRILGHSDVAPQRKQDPGHLFPWERLAREGLGMWSESFVRSFDFAATQLRSGRTEKEEMEPIITAVYPEPAVASPKPVRPERRSLKETEVEGSNETKRSFHPFPPKEWWNAHNDDIMGMLSQLGYDTTSPPHTLLAFQRHFQPHKVDGIPDDETYALLQGLLKAQEMLI